MVNLGSGDNMEEKDDNMHEIAECKDNTFKIHQAAWPLEHLEESIFDCATAFFPEACDTENKQKIIFRALLIMRADTFSDDGEVTEVIQKVTSYCRDEKEFTPDEAVLEKFVTDVQDIAVKYENGRKKEVNVRRRLASRPIGRLHELIQETMRKSRQ